MTIRNSNGNSDTKFWPNRFFRIILWPIANFEWLREIRNQQLYHSLDNAIAVEMPSSGVVTIFGHSLAPCCLFENGVVRVGDEQFGPNKNFQKKLIDQGVAFVREDHVLRMITINKKRLQGGITIDMATDWYYAYENGTWWQWRRGDSNLLKTLVQEFNRNIERGEHYIIVVFATCVVSYLGLVLISLLLDW